MAAARAFVRKYLIFIVIFLWVVAWANRDWLAGGLPSAEDTYAEAENFAELSEPAQPADDDAPDASPVSSAPHDGAVPYGASSAAPMLAASESTLMAPKAAGADTDATKAKVGSVHEAGLTAIPGDLPGSEPHAPVVTTDATGPSADAMTGVRDRKQVSVAVSENVDREAKSGGGEAGASDAGSPDDKLAAAALAERQAELLARARAVARSRGPLAAAGVLDQGLRELPSTAPGRADLYGEMGNYQFTARDFTAALAAYDAAVKTLPADERSVMLRRLAPIYDRHHPDGRSHLEQFR